MKLQAAFNKTNIISKHVCSVVQEVSLKSISIMRNSYATIIKSTTYNIMMNIYITINKKMNSSQSNKRTVSESTVILVHNIKVTNLFYACACSTEYQSHMIREKCFDYSQKNTLRKII